MHHNKYHIHLTRPLHHKFQEICIQLLRSELIYDVQFVTNRFARTLATDDKGRAKKAAESIEANDTTDTDYIERLFTEAVTEAKSRTSFASGMRGTRMVTDEVPEKTEEHTFVFRLPYDWRGDAQTLAHLLHSYVAYHAISHWLSLSSIAQAADYSEKADFYLRDAVAELRKQAPAPLPYLTDLMH